MTEQQAWRSVLVLVGAAALLLVIPRPGPVSPAPPSPAPSPAPAPPPEPSLEPVLERLERWLTPQGDRIRSALIPYDQAIQAAASIWGLDTDLIGAVIWQESKGDSLAARFEPRINDTSYGLMQILLGTARSLGFAGTVPELLEPSTNIMLGAQYLRSRFDQYGDLRLSVASYNSGSPIPTNGLLVNESYVTAVLKHLAALKGELVSVA